MPLDSDRTMRALVPLKVVLLTENPGREHAALRGALFRAFQGGAATTEAVEAYFAAGEDLGVPVLDITFQGDGSEARALLAAHRTGALHTVVVAVLHDAPGPDFGRWLRELDQQAKAEPDDRPALLLLCLELKRDTWRGAIQSLDYASLGEAAARPALAASRVLSSAWRAMGEFDRPLSLFISHAKLDGLPLAQSFRRQLNDFGASGYFYDAECIPPGADWQRVLRRGVQQAVLVALRTNVYEERFWCVQEMDWAEDFGCPVVVVEARTQLTRAREFLPVGGAPTVHIPDGNLLRVLQFALREALRVRLFRRQVDELADLGAIDSRQTVTIPRTSLATLGMRCADRATAGSDVRHVLIPESFREAHRGVASKLVDAYFPGAWLGTPRELATLHL